MVYEKRIADAGALIRAKEQACDFEEGGAAADGSRESKFEC